MSDSTPSRQSGISELWGIVLLTLSALMVLSLVSYRWEDILLLKVPSNDPPLNFIGPAGAWFAFVSLMILGLGAFLLPIVCGMMGLFFLFRSAVSAGRRLAWGCAVILAVSGLLTLHASGWGSLCAQFNISGITGGLFGWLVADQWIEGLLGNTGATVLMAGLLVCGLIMFVGKPGLFRFFHGISQAALFLKTRFREMLDARRDQLERIDREEREIARQIAQKEKEMKKEQRQPRTVMPEPSAGPQRPETIFPVMEPPPAKPRKEPEKQRAKPEKPAPAGALLAASAAPPPADYQLPPLSILQPIPSSNDRTIKGDVQTTARVLKETLAEFGIECEVKNIVEGPVVTRYELLPAAGVRVERIGQLSNNLALTLKAQSIRVQAPIPGKGLVGIEVPNMMANKVYLREILEGEQWQSSKAAIPLILGKDVGGSDLIADLATMPHLLIAGATGSGKTVCMNSILAGLLMSRKPSELKMILVDPKIIEFSVYQDIPHLLVPVITEAKKVAFGLRWAINEMEKRYKIFARAGVRNIQSFNVRPPVVAPPPESSEDGAETPLPDTLPYIVIIIDELADLMLVAQADVENSIARLAQLSRAVGIHMILATQRPSVNVITGTIKANFPARLSFQVAQQVDSRTILDGPGAEKLLGRGDMLILPPGVSKLVRAQGAMTTDDDIKAIVEFIKKQSRPDYIKDLKEKIENPAASLALEDDGIDDDLLQMAVAIIRESRKASVSHLQRRLRIGYNRAGRLMDKLEEMGIVGPAHGSDPREILVDLDGDIPAGSSNQEEKE
ncbi:MAG: DNA translocase FtsK [Verrucomicrobia bacterium]|nr:DNA translocase FtsK [Verrucomicrobiota bacterium]MCG2681511.1 DNA translocase FtsK [Kiritimatiellia bacterium]MBU4248275.1 DNA translocase FtsK [Verrucomicrobiota bacterium]MBU4289891.1 DNA translocase FtsK [Verrucomicrobiota bacterium]MBU4428190.1 DNA translocase FtsK [Verrucomicrobiota bacterium]